MRNKRRPISGSRSAGLAPLITRGTWTVYARSVIGVAAGSPLGGGSVIGLAPVARRTLILSFHWGTFGLVFWPWAVTLPFLIAGRVRGTAGFYQASALTVLGVLVLTFAGMTTSYGGGPEEFLGSSYKRDLFYVASLAGIAAALSRPWEVLARRGRGWFRREPA